MATAKPLLASSTGNEERRERDEVREDGRNDCSTAAAKLALVKDAFEANERPQRHDMLNITTCAFWL